MEGFVMADGWHPKVSAAHAAWLQLRNDGLLPGRADFDPTTVPALLPNIWLIDVQVEPLRFRYRLIGTAVAFALGHELRGRWLDEYSADFENSVFAKNLKEVVFDGKPRHYRGPSSIRYARDVAEVECIMLPLASDGRKVDMLLGLTVFFDPKGHEVGPPRR